MTFSAAVSNNLDEFDAVLAAIDEDLLETDPNFSSTVELAVGNIPNANEERVFLCLYCEKRCLSQGGLTRHLNAKHKDKLIDKQFSKEKKIAELILHSNCFQNYLIQSAEKLAIDECYPTKIRTEFKNFKLTCIEVNTAYSLIKSIIESFDGNAENFYPAFYKIFSEAPSPFKNLSQNCTLLLSFEVANLVLAHLTGASFNNDVLTFKHESYQFTEKEKSIIAYLSGYVFGTFYRRIRFSSNMSSLYHKQCLSFLLAGKCTGETISLPEHKHVNLHDRGGLWKVSKEVICIFTTAEYHFISMAKKSSHTINCKEIVDTLIKDSFVLVNFSKIIHSSTDKVQKEIALNLLEDLLTLYIRVRTFSYVKDKLQAFKISKSQTKSNALRKAIKKKVSTLEQGH